LSESDALNSSATSSYPTTKTEPKSNHPAPLIKEISDGQAEAIRACSITQSQHNAEEDVQKKSKSELLKCDGQVSENETDVKDLDEFTVMENEPETVEDGWDAEGALTEAFALLKVAEWR